MITIYYKEFPCHCKSTNFSMFPA